MYELLKTRIPKDMNQLMILSATGMYVEDLLDGTVLSFNSLMSLEWSFLFNYLFS
jgi:hypothetical protein